MDPTELTNLDSSALYGMISPLVSMGATIVMKIIGAILLWIVGRWIIRIVKRMAGKALQKQSAVDDTLTRYFETSLGVLLNILLIIAVLGVFGVETASFAGLIAAGGVAIGLAWSGLLSNFAAGVFLVILRPFHVGDFVTAAGVTGTVMDVGLFVTTINTLDNVQTIVGNNSVFTATIQNFSSNPYRRVDLVAQLDHTVDHDDAVRRLKEALAAIPNVETDPAPDVEILEFTLAGPVLAVRPYTNNEHYWQVYFDTNKAIREVGGTAGYPAPKQHFEVLQGRAAQG